METSDGRRLQAEGITFRGDELRLSGGETLSRREVQPLRPAPTADGTPGILELILRDGRVKYARSASLAPGGLRIRTAAGGSEELPYTLLRLIRTP